MTQIATKQYLCFLVLGFSTFITYFCIMASTNYWQYYYSATFMTYASFMYCISEIFGTSILMIIQKRVGSRFFIYNHYIVCLIAFISIILMNQIKDQKTKYIITLIPVFFCGFTAAQFSSTIIACSTRIGPNITQATQIGIGVCGILIQLLKNGVSVFIVEDSNSPNLEKSLYLNMLMYFGLTFVIVLLCFIPWRWVEKNTSCVQNLNVNKQQEQQSSLVVSIETQQQPKNSVSQVFKKISLPTICLALSNAITYMIYPAFVIKLHLYSNSSQNWWNLGVLTCHTFFDFVGRILPRFLCKKQKMTLVNTICILRLSFIPLFYFMTNYESENGIYTQKPSISSPILYILIEAVFSFSQCFALTAGYMKYQEKLNAEEKAVGAVVISLATNIGLGIGAGISLFFA
ncbi:Nucleoside_transporter [Hexamita inflata]|uniref:Nucleoside transporter n=1 Tax=Hexamita inflata TaxID=28002 RepID=A0AA86N465_9EUKA|nr:Nucleoside transporter [Hexamita inflata]